MTKNKKKNNPRGKQTAAAPKPKPKAQTPFSDAGAIVGSKLGTMFNAPYLKGVGKWLGSGIGSIFGSGDYTVVGPRPEYNVLMNGNQIPQFSSTSGSNIICHREYLGDIGATTNFTVNNYPLNPGISKTFPWLSVIAQNFQQYKFHGVIFEFRPLLTDFVVGGAPGVVVLSTNYNADAPSYNTKQEMENSEFAVSCKPTVSMIHGIECATNQTVLSQLYVRNGANPAGVDLKTTDLGKMQFATQNNPAGSDLGELWVSYCVEFFKPILPNDVGGDVESFRAYRVNYSAVSPLGVLPGTFSGDLEVTATSTDITWINAQPGNYYLVYVSWDGVAPLAITYPVATVTGGSFVNFFSGLTLANDSTPAPGTATASASVSFVIQAATTPAIGVPLALKFGAASVMPVNSNVNIVVTQFSSEAAVA